MKRKAPEWVVCVLILVGVLVACAYIDYKGQECSKSIKTGGELSDELLKIQVAQPK